MTDMYYKVVDNFKEAYAEMMGHEKETQLSRKVEQAASYRRAKRSEREGEDGEEDDSYDGPNAIMVVKEPQNAWESMKARLSESPLIQEILKSTRKATKAAGETPLGKRATQINTDIKDRIADVREAWETSQNPLVYTVSGIVDNLTGETEEGLAITEIRRFDPQFNKEDWAAEVLETLVPTVLRAHLQGDSKALKPFLKVHRWKCKSVFQMNSF